MKLWQVGGVRPDYTMTIRDDDVTCERKGFILYRQNAVIGDDNDDDNNVCGCGSPPPYQVEVVDSVLNECKSKQECAKLCSFVFANTYNINTEASLLSLCEIEIY